MFQTPQISPQHSTKNSHTVKQLIARMPRESSTVVHWHWQDQDAGKWIKIEDRLAHSLESAFDDEEGTIMWYDDLKMWGCPGISDGGALELKFDHKQLTVSMPQGSKNIQLKREELPDTKSKDRVALDEKCGVPPLGAFPHPFLKGEYEFGDTPYFVTEIEILMLSATIREKPDWQTKLNNKTILKRWKKEAVVDDDVFDYVVAQLKHLASLKGPIVDSVVEGVWQADELILPELREALLKGVVPLENVPDHEKDWHPGTNEQVLDLVHPSLFCFVAGVTPQLPVDVLSDVIPPLKILGSGKVVPVTEKKAEGEKDKEKEEKEEKKVKEDEGEDEEGADKDEDDKEEEDKDDKEESEDDIDIEDFDEDEFQSHKFQWLPADFQVSKEGKVSILSYINNLHPVKHAALYGTIGNIFELFVPMFEKVLTRLNNPRRILPENADYYPTFEDYKEAKNLGELHSLLVRGYKEGDEDKDSYDEDNEEDESGEEKEAEDDEEVNECESDNDEGASEKDVKWRWNRSSDEADEDDWVEFSEKQIQEIEEAYQKFLEDGTQQNFPVDKERHINFKKMKQVRNDDPERCRKVKRSMVQATISTKPSKTESKKKPEDEDEDEDEDEEKEEEDNKEPQPKRAKVDTASDNNKEASDKAEEKDTENKAEDGVEKKEEANDSDRDRYLSLLWAKKFKVKIPDVPEFTPYIEANPINLNGRRLQVIVKLANIILTPKKPNYAGGSWHVEGMQNEHIVASGIYYYDSENLTESKLEFRAGICEPNYEQDDRKGLEEAYALVDEAPLNQLLGGLVTQTGRAIAFPNLYQHYVAPFSLKDKKKPGHRKILVFFLIDPAYYILSTLQVPPQQPDWKKAWITQFRPWDKLPKEIVERIFELASPMTLEEAKQHREELMKERKFFTKENNKVFERPFSLCEH